MSFMPTFGTMDAALARAVVFRATDPEATARLVAVHEEETRLTETFSRSHFSGVGRLPFLAPCIVEAHTKFKKAIMGGGEGLLPSAFSHEDAADLLLEIAKVANVRDPADCYAPVELVPLVDYLVLWLKHRAPESRRVRERHLAPLLAQLIRYIHVLRKVDDLITKAGHHKRRVYVKVGACVSSAYDNMSIATESVVSVDAVVQVNDLLTDLAGVAYQLNMMRCEIRPMLLALRRPCEHVAGLINKSLEREQDRHVPAGAYAGIVTRVHNASGTCAICLDGLADRDDETGQPRRAAHRLACGHQFHPTCLYKLLVSTGTNTACPICRFETMPDAA